MLMAANLHAGPPVVVELHGGERLTAEVDGRTSSQELWLRYAYGNTQILRPIAWDRIARGSVGSEEFDAAALRQKALQLRTAYEPPMNVPKPATTPRPDSPGGSPASAAGDVRSRRVESIWADAELANWDSDPEFDGLLLRLVALDCYGAPVVAAGTVEAELWEDLVRRPISLGRWTCAVPALAPANSVDWPIFVHRLPFQGSDPWRDPSISKWGMLRVSFAVPGHGVLEYSLSDVLLRREAPRSRWSH
jgi:hypothetical protein